MPQPSINKACGTSYSFKLSKTGYYHTSFLMASTFFIFFKLFSKPFFTIRKGTSRRMCLEQSFDLQIVFFYSCALSLSSEALHLRSSFLLKNRRTTRSNTAPKGNAIHAFFVKPATT